MRRVLPPTLVLALAAVMAAANVARPTPRLVTDRWRWLGAPLIFGGLALTIASNRRFEQRGTNVVTFDDPDHLVADGPFRWSRNPMYVGFESALVGGAIVAGSLAAWVGPLVFAAAAAGWYVPFEERRMHAVFGADYVQYRRRVARWVGRPREVGTP